MKKVAILLFILISCFRGYSQEKFKVSSVGIDLGSAIRKECIRIFVGHEIGERWSVSADCGISMRALIKKTDKEEAAHKIEFEETSSEAGSAYRGGAAIQFWPSQGHEGIFLSTSIRHYNTKGLGCMVGAGYMMRTIHGLSFFISVEKPIIDSDRQNGGMTIGICWIFKN